jgi:hypothetical protein
MKTREIQKIGFTEDCIYIKFKSGEIKKSPLEWFPKLLNASAEQRENYTVSPMGIHWEELDEDLSFDGFFTYEKKKPNEISLFFQRFPEISMTKFAERTDISPAMLRHYVCGTKTPSEKRKKEIEKALHDLGRKLISVEF